MAAKKTHTPHKGGPANTGLLFKKKNYQLMLAGLGVTIIGFLLMSGKTDIYDFRKTVLAPVVVLAGFIVQFFAILKK